MSLHADRLRAESFGSQAEAYDRYRPDYPGALIDDLMAAGPKDALDVGCGTGKAAVQLAARGVTVLGIEVDSRMAEIARRHGVPVEVSTFEKWDDNGRRFDLIVSGQAWHWVDASVGAAKAAALLRPGGTLAVFWSFPRFDEPTRVAIEAAYLAAAADIGADSTSRGVVPTTAEDQHDLLVEAGFHPVDLRDYEWDRSYTVDEWLALIGRHSDHATLPPEQLADIRAHVGLAIESLGGTLPVRYVTEAVIAGHA